MIEPKITLELSEQDYNEIQDIRRYRNNCGGKVLLIGLNKFTLREEVRLVTQDEPLQELMKANNHLSNEVESLRKQLVDLQFEIQNKRKWYNFF